MLLIFYFSSQNAEQSTQTSAWFLQFLPFSMHIVRKLAGRSPQITDICIDTCGALSLILLNIGLIRWKSSQKAL